MAIQTRWVWPVYPLACGSCGNLLKADDGTPPGELTWVYRVRRGPRTKYLLTGKVGPSKAYRERRQVYVPTPDDLARMKGVYPADDPHCPRWNKIGNKLLLAGKHTRGELDATVAPELLRLLTEPAAQRIIVRAAERAGLDGSSVAVSGELCRQALGQNPELGDVGDWPECLNAVRKIEGPAENIAAIREAKRTMIRLEARLSAQGERADVEPDDTITVDVVLQKFNVSRSTLGRYRSGGKLTGWRYPGAKVNSPYRYSKAELRRFWREH